MRATTASRPETATAVANLIRFLETGAAPDGLFTPDAFADLSLPHWRIQAGTAEEILAIRSDSHPFPGQVRVERVEQTDHGFTDRVRGAVGPRRPALVLPRDDPRRRRGRPDRRMSVYCTGDWDEARQREHTAAVRLIRP
jgi:hypothetical protein